MTPIFPLTAPPTCRRCGHPSTRRIVKPPNERAGRPYFNCTDTCHPESEFVSYDDYEGIEAGNPPCWCPDRFTSRRDKTNREPRKYFYKCPLGRCKFYAWGGEVEAQDGMGYGYGGGGGDEFPGSGSSAMYVKVEEIQADWTGAAGLSGHATYARPAYETQTDHDSAYGSQGADPSVHAPASARNRIDEIDYYGSQAAGPSTHTALPASTRNRIDEIDYWAAAPSQPTADIGRRIEIQSYHGEAVSSFAPAKATQPNGIAFASSSVHVMPPHPSQSLQKQTEETRPTNGVTSGAPVLTPISSMEDAFGRKYGAAQRRRCCGICAVM